MTKIIDGRVIEIKRTYESSGKTVVEKLLEMFERNNESSKEVGVKNANTPQAWIKDEGISSKHPMIIDISD